MNREAILTSFVIEKVSGKEISRRNRRWLPPFILGCSDSLTSALSRGVIHIATGRRCAWWCRITDHSLRPFVQPLHFRSVVERVVPRDKSRVRAGAILNDRLILLYHSMHSVWLALCDDWFHSTLIVCDEHRMAIFKSTLILGNLLHIFQKGLERPLAVLLTVLERDDAPVRLRLDTGWLGLFKARGVHAFHLESQSRGFVTVH